MIKNKMREIKFGWKHILIIFLVLIVFQVFVSNLQQNTLRDLVADTMDWSKQHSAEQIGNLTAAALEILLETKPSYREGERAIWEQNLIHGINSILKQPLMNRNVEEICVILPYKNTYIAFDLGNEVFNYFYNKTISDSSKNTIYSEPLSIYKRIHSEILASESTTTLKDGEDAFEIFVPLVPNGEYSGSIFLRVRPDVSFISSQVLSSFNQTVLVFSCLIIMGFLGMFYISSYTIIDRDEARELLYLERESHLKDKIAKEKEYHFTKRIYHTHHKAEKVMGFINEDIENADESNVNIVKQRISKYANFISRVIYDMKWFTPPIQTIRGTFFNTNLNDTLQFLVDNVFMRISNPVSSVKFNLKLDNNLPIIHVNEYVAWEIIEPIIQNSIDHANKDIVEITLVTSYNEQEKNIYLEIIDNGEGISDDLLEMENGIQKLFLENVSTKHNDNNRGYGCFLAYEISKRCGWNMTAEKYSNGTKFVICISV